MNYIRITFIQDTEIKFIDPDTGRMAWYGSDYAKGTSIDVVDVLSGNAKEIRVKCMDGEIGVLETAAVRIGR
jgi:hypothetical protein